MLLRLARGALALLRVPTATGRAIIALALVAWAASARTDIVELRMIALMCGLSVLLAVPWLLIPMRVHASLALRPPRAMAGDQVEITLTVRNEGRLSLWQPLVHLPVGERDRWLRMPTLPPQERRSHDTVGDDLERGVLEVGPAVAVRSDPLGLLRRTVRWCDPIQLYVRPRMVLLSTLGSGQVRDLEGVPSDRISMSDLSFHALREYVPGDDLRHVHWRSSARAGELLVRQYHDTRRNHATVVLDSTPASYRDDEDYELAVSVAASLVMCAAREEYDVSLLSGSERVTAVATGVVLDATCRVQREPDTEPLAGQVQQALVMAPETSLLFVVTGASDTDLDALSVALVSVPADTRCVVLRAVPGDAPSVVRQHGHELVTVGSLAELPGVMAAAS
ncbi:hypothetical protein CF8_0002 [Nocardioides sp. CF8]|uniref:DUF58 domain-containing protein n=1 Tax=Nocardioides sp. CF8 TaxID=110319 RepID=UPI00032FB77F|nr:DUF58 domain-containing protein [Nocardioides sp. CF8]EON25817.1 hypothetical protein CF8_0002 [Nocardioides sp. CF8]